MRPLRLVFQAFGSFPGTNEVDFDLLRRTGLFVVTGPTGTGKTTIFDAMCFALYGVLPGGRAADGDPRSHHAAPDVATFVRFEFESEGVRYCVEREPRQERPKARGAGTTVAEPKATLVEVRPDGSTVPLATGATNVTRECERLVGLEARHFQRVVLLPQGRFTDFLVATDETREQLLRQLFGGELYERATALLKRRVDDLRAQVGEVSEVQRRHRHGALEALGTLDGAWGQSLDPEVVPRVDAVDLADAALDARLTAAVDAFEPVRSEHHEEVHRLRAESTAAQERFVVGEAVAQRYDEAAALRADQQAAEAQADAVEALAAQVSASMRARPVVAADREQAIARQRLTEAAEARARLEQVVVDGFAELGGAPPSLDAASVATALTTERQRLAAVEQQLLDAEQAVEHATQLLAQVRLTGERLAQAEADAAAVRHQAELARQAVAQLEPEARQLPQRQVDLERAEDRLDRRRRLDAAQAGLDRCAAATAEAERAYVDTMRQFVAGAAPRLAEQLHAGEPCPVCGSADHPHPARADGDHLVDLDAVDAARAALDVATTARGQQHSVVADLLTSLGDDAATAIDEFVAAQQHAEQACAAAQQADSDLAAAQHRVVDLAVQTERADADIANLRREHAVQHDRAQAASEAARHLVEQVEGIDRERLMVEVAVVDHLIRDTADASRVFEAVSAADALREEAERRARAALVSSGFPTVDAAAAALLDEAMETGLQQQADEWHRARIARDVRLEQLREQGLPEARPRLEALRADADAARRLADQAFGDFTTASDALDRARRALADLADVAAGATELLAQQVVAETVFRTCNGEAGRRVKLERWVLGVELDRVTEAANEHLVRMTNHRYRLRRSSGQRTSLGLEVFDAHTGRARSTATLSGGEQFQASLALALGLADVVSQGGTGSGRRFEALFVDEGFGSLDPSSLDDAIVALQQLHATGRMVGAITHVDAMKQSLPVGIEVVPLPNGRGSRLEVLP